MIIICIQYQNTFVLIEYLFLYARKFIICLGKMIVECKIYLKTVFKLRVKLVRKYFRCLKRKFPDGYGQPIHKMCLLLCLAMSRFYAKLV